MRGSQLYNFFIKNRLVKKICEILKSSKTEFGRNRHIGWWWKLGSIVIWLSPCSNIISSSRRYCTSVWENTKTWLIDLGSTVLTVPSPRSEKPISCNWNTCMLQWSIGSVQYCPFISSRVLGSSLRCYPVCSSALSLWSSVLQQLNLLLTCQV